MTVNTISSFLRRQESRDFSSLNCHVLRAKNARPLPSQGPRSGVFVAMTIAVVLAGCNDISITFGDMADSVKGSGVSASETRSVANFTSIEASGVGKLNVRVGDGESLRITADNNLLPLIKSEVRDGVLILSSKSGFKSKNEITYEVSAKTIKRLENSGTVSIDAKGFTGGELAVETSGVGNITLAGRVDSLNAGLSGVGSLEAEELVADRVKTSLSGVGSASVRAEKSINGNVSGIGSLTWKGAATDVSTSVSGIGRVSKG